MKSRQGQLLVASPHLADGNFFRSVVFLLQHDDEGAFGVVLNRPTNHSLREVWEDLGETDDVPDLPILVGGPVEGPLLVLHQNSTFAESQVLPDVYLSTDKDSLKKLLVNKDWSSPIRVFRGYSGWGASQLEGELEMGGWLLTPASAAEIFYEKDDLWEHVVRKIGLKIIAPAISPERVPEDPSVN